MTASQPTLFDTTPNLYRRVEDGEGRRRIPFDVTARKHKGNPESVAANERVKVSKEQTRREVLAWFIGRGKAGGTADELAAAFGCVHNHVSPRCSELLKTGELVRTPSRRKTRSGCNAAVICAREWA